MTKVEFRKEAELISFSWLRKADDEKLRIFVYLSAAHGVPSENITKCLTYCANITDEQAEELDRKGESITDMFNLYPDMLKRRVDIILCNENAKVPEYKTPSSAGADLFANLENEIIIYPNQRLLIPTGIKIELPIDAEAQVRPRSGLSLKRGLVAIIGTIDSDYQGEVGIILHNVSDTAQTIFPGDRLAQIVLNGRGGLFQAVFNEVKEFKRSSERGENGFGHTGVK